MPRHTAYDDIGKIFGKLKVLEVISNKRASNGGFIVLTECIDCGVQEELEICRLRSGRTLKCKNERRPVVNNLVGQTFDWLTVIKDSGQRDSSNGAILWECKCVCGNTVLRLGRNLHEKTNHHFHSCGCYFKEDRRLKAEKRILNKKWGYLTPIEVLNETRSHLFRVLCKCDCGNTTVRNSAIFNPNYICEQKCEECMRKDHRRPIGEHIGNLIIKEYVENENKELIGYNCLCEVCGLIKYLDKTEYQNRTRRMKTAASCGCNTKGKSYGEAIIQQILDENDIIYIHDKAYFKDLKVSENGIGRYDFIIFNEQQQPIRLIEYDGIQHFENINRGYYDKQTLFDRQKKDKIKDDYAKQHHIPLVKIPYTMFGNLSYDLLFNHKELEIL